MKFCPICAKSAHEDSRYCDSCGYAYTMAAQQTSQYGEEQPDYYGGVRPIYYTPNMDRARLYKNKKSTILVTTFLLGWIGGHKFYLGKPLQGLLMALSCWTLIPLCISILEGVRYICLTPEELYDSVTRE